MGQHQGQRGTRGRAGALALASAAVSVVVVAVLLWSLGGAGAEDGDPGSVVRRPGPEGDAAGGFVPDPLPEGPREPMEKRSVEERLSAYLGELDLPGAPVDVFVEDLAGEPLLRTVPPKIPPALAMAVRVAFVPTGAAPGSSIPGAEAVPMTRGVQRSEKGWYTEVQPPREPSAVALMLGDAVIAAVDLEPKIDEVHLRADPAAVAAYSATVRGRLLGFADAAKFVKLLPARRGRRAVAPVRATGEGDAFELTGIPPGPVTLQVRLHPGVFARIERQSDGTSGVLVQSPRRLRDEDQWEGRLGALGQVPLPLHVVEFELVPGEERDLGTLQPETAGAVVLHLEDAAGEALDAVNVQVLALSEPALEVDPPDATTFANRILLTPVPTRTLELFIRMGERGAIVRAKGTSLAAGTIPPPMTCALRPMGVVVLPGTGAGLITPGGGAIGPDPRWQGARYLDVKVDAATRLVPPGRYVLRRGDGTTEELTLGAGQVWRAEEER